MGYFVTDNGKSKALAFRKEDFLKNDLPLFFQNINLLNIDFEELRNRFEIFKKEETETFSADTTL